MPREKYDQEFKDRALALAVEKGNVAEAAREVGIRPGLLYRWQGKAKPAKLSLGSERKAKRPQGKPLVEVFAEEAKAKGFATEYPGEWREKTAHPSGAEMSDLRRENAELKRLVQAQSAVLARMLPGIRD